MATNQHFEINDRILHTDYGPGIVTFVGDNYLGLRFPSVGDMLQRCDVAKISRWTTEAEAAWQVEMACKMAVVDQAKLDWPQSTFKNEAPDTPHYMGSHWPPFVEDVADIVKDLPNILQEAQVMESIGNHRKSPRELPQNWPQGFHLVWPMQRRGLILTCCINAAEQQTQLMSFYPFSSEGVQHTLTIDSVAVWEGQAEAQITVSLGEAQITFFDAHFLINRLWYEAGRRYEFILSGIAYAVEPVQVMEIPFTANPDQIAWQRLLGNDADEDNERELPSVINLKGMASLLPIADWDKDEYSFRGPVKSVKPIDDFLGQTGWRVRVTVMRLSGYETEDVDLDIVITRRIWRQEQSPEVGMDIEGALWLQGYLWMPPNLDVKSA
jgi:hypothetical protein